MKKTELEKIIKESLEELKKTDWYLLENDVHEQSITSKLACYITQRMMLIQNSSWHVDVEYNKNVNAPKSLPRQGKVKPDIIIHRRGMNNENGNEDNNLLIIELKKKPSQKEKADDIAKIKAFIEELPYRFKYGVFIAINPIELIWYER